MRRIVLQPDDNVFPVSARDVAGIQQQLKAIITKRMIRPATSITQLNILKYCNVLSCLMPYEYVCKIWAKEP
jgi:hypothetical protein